MDTKMEYEAPTLTEVGSFEEITQTNNVGQLTDANLPTGVIPVTS